MKANSERSMALMPTVPLWQTWGLRLVFLLMVVFLGPYQWSMILGDTADWTPWRGVGHVFLATMAVVSLVGVFHPVKLLPVMLFEIGWKSLWLLAIAFPALLNNREIPDVLYFWPTVIGIVIMVVLVPWRYVWWLYFIQPIDPWRPVASNREP